jgi:hypothetical protein
MLTPRGRANVVASSQSMWNHETDLFYIPGSNRLTLSAQKPLIRVIVQDAIDDIRASLLFVHAFPEGPDKVTLVQGALLAVAEKYKPGSTHIHERLMHDREYMAQMSRLVRVIFVKYYITETCRSHVFGSRCFEAKPRSTAMHLSLEHSRLSTLQKKLQGPRKCKLPNTTIYSRWRHM